MSLCEEQLQECNAFLDLIANEEGDYKLSDAIDNMKEQIEHTADYAMSEYGAEVLIDYLDDIWSLVSAKEKQENNYLVSYYEGLRSDLEIAAGYHDEDSACGFYGEEE